MPLRLTLLSNGEKQRIHESVLDVLQNVGIKFNSTSALEILGDSGCEINQDDKSAKIPGHLVNKALETVSKSFTLAARSPEKDVTYGMDGPYFLSAAQSVFYRDLRTRERRVGTIQDLTDVTVLCDALNEIDLFCPMIVPNDIHPYLRGLRAGQVAFNNTDKHIVGGVGALETLPYHLEIWDALLGDRARLKERHMMTHIINDVSPLQKDGNLVDVTLALGEYQFPILLYYMPMAGSTAPVTLSGTLIEMTANMLASIVLYQFAQPGWPIIWGAGPGTLDMKTGRFAGGAEAALISIGQVELAQFYGIPSMSGWIGSYESKQIDFQSGMDATLGVVPTVLAGADGIWGPGDLDGSNLVDLPFVLLGTDLVRQVRRLLSGITFDDDHFLFDVIAAMRFQGDYLADPSTKKYFRQEHLIPDLFPRESFESWEARGQTEEEMALSRVQKILDTHKPTPLPDDVRVEIDRIIKAAENVLTK